MKLREKQHIQAMSQQELGSQLQALKKQVKEIALNRFTKPSKNVRESAVLRRKIAMMQTRLQNGVFGEVQKEK